jgi:hypothetical protein
MSRRSRLAILIAVVALGLLGLFALVGVVTSERSGSAGNTATVGRSVSSGSVTGMPANEAVPQPATAPASKSAADGLSAGSTGTGSQLTADVPPATAASAHYLVRNGDLWLTVARGSLLTTVDRITAMTGAMGGYVVSSAMGTSQTAPGQGGIMEPQPLATDSSTAQTLAPAPPVADGTPYAMLTVRVPETNFDAAVRRFAALGHVESASTSSEDVTSQFVDLQARLQHYQSVERRLVRFLAQTGTISQMLAVQDRIDQTQLTIEQLSAELKSMRETTSYGTLTVSLTEKGGHHVVVAAHTGFTGRFLHSVAVIGRGARVTGLWLAGALPFFLLFGAIAAAAWYAARRLRRGRRQPAQPSLPA